MSNEWIDLSDIQAVAIAQAEGWEVEQFNRGEWVAWSEAFWHLNADYRGRPKQPQEVTYECYDVDGRLEWWHPNRNVAKPWPRHPELDKTAKVTK
jgi:hypothetical protein